MRRLHGIAGCDRRSGEGEHRRSWIGVLGCHKIVDVVGGVVCTILRAWNPPKLSRTPSNALTLQRRRSFRIVTCMPGEGSVKDNPVMRFLEKLKQLQSELMNVDDIDELVECLKELSVCVPQKDLENRLLSQEMVQWN